MFLAVEIFLVLKSMFFYYQVPFSHQIKQEAEVKTGAVGLITNATQAEEILQKEEADVILLARELLRNPIFCSKKALGKNNQVFFPHNTKEVNLKIKRVFFYFRNPFYA